MWTWANKDAPAELQIEPAVSDEMHKHFAVGQVQAKVAVFRSGSLQCLLCVVHKAKALFLRSSPEDVLCIVCQILRYGASLDGDDRGNQSRLHGSERT